METRTATEVIGSEWDGAEGYYNNAETKGWMAPFWGEHSPFLRCMRQMDLAYTVELACGHGRHTEHIILGRMDGVSVQGAIVVDINESNIEFCKGRFSQFPNVAGRTNNGSDLSFIKEGSQTAVFCYDAMVHFEFHDVVAYVPEIFRVLKPGGMALLHHSNNYEANGQWYGEVTRGRNFMSDRIMSHVAQRAGFEVASQIIIPWDGVPNLDCITLLKKPTS